MTPEQVLSRSPERLPEWLANYNPGDVLNVEILFSSRIVFYPGAGFDGHAVRLFGSAHAAHVFVYVDYGITKDQILEQLDENHPGHFKGYRVLGIIDLSEHDLTPCGWRGNVHPNRERPGPQKFASAPPFGFVTVFLRDQTYNDSHGPQRFALLFLGADGIATYDALFCQPDSVAAPYGVLLQDHGFGGNYDRFGHGGLLEQLAVKAMPEWLLVGEGTEAWEGYERVAEANYTRGGMGNTKRFLYRRKLTQLKPKRYRSSLLKDRLAAWSRRNGLSAIVVRLCQYIATGYKRLRTVVFKPPG